MNILLTGASGFLGKNILEVNESLIQPFHIFSFGRTIPKPYLTTHNFWKAPEKLTLEDLNYDKVIHVAGKAHLIPTSENEVKAFHKINYEGTLRLIESLEKLSILPKQFIFISSSAVYGLNKGESISESTPLLPNTPYGKSKADAEKLLTEWSENKKINLLILRLPLIAGVNPPGNLGALKNAIIKGKYIKIKNSKARKSIVLASDVAHLVLGDSALKGIFNLTDGVNPTFSQVENAIEKRVGKKVKLSLNLYIFQLLAKIGDLFLKFGIKKIPLNSLKLSKITSTLTFDDSKAQEEINWRPNPVIPFLEKNI